MRKRSTSSPAARTDGSVNLSAAALLLALLVSWVVGATHLTSHHGHDPVGDLAGHHDGHGVATAVHGQGKQHGHEHPHDEDGPVVHRAAVDHDCAVVDLWSTLGGYAPGEAPPCARRAAPAVAQVPRAGHVGTSGVPLHLLAPKNSPPGRAARVRA